ncbi:MAG: GIY-YIG nuclease family protein [Legionellales bacterium]|nr:GIY-YIG nuclease family protein [Legionellales bacterium]
MLKRYYVYLLECEHNRFYTGITTDPERRWQQHVSGRGAKFTRAFKPLKMVRVWDVGESRALAQKIEYQIKQLSHQEKKILGADYPAISCAGFLLPHDLSS